MSIEDLIKRLPDELQDLVRTHIKTVTQMETSRLQEWLMQIAGRHWNGAYQALNERLSPDGRLAEQDRLNALMQYYNKQNKAQVDMWRNFFYSLIAILIQSVPEEID